MEQQLYLNNYTAAGDIVVLGVCFVMGILIATSSNFFERQPSDGRLTNVCRRKG